VTTLLEDNTFHLQPLQTPDTTDL